VPDLVQVSGLRAGYGATVILEDIDLSIAPQRAVAVLGRNGVGKTTLLATLMGHTTVHAGSIVMFGRRIDAQPTYRRARSGLAYVPQGREIFPSLTVEENLQIAERAGGRWSLEAVYDLFPRLAERHGNFGNQLSGGEQQMLSIGRALMGNPKLLLLDEPLEGLAPVIVDGLLAAIRRLIDEGLTAILVEQSAKRALEITHEAIVLNRGRIAWAGASSALLQDSDSLGALLAPERHTSSV
jgi:branched-chain amino acid transport system ATP-binding protein